MKKTTVIIQARMGATRLPGKVLLPLPMNSDVSVLEQVYKRAADIKGVEQVIVATTQNGKDDAVEKWADKHNCEIFRGSEKDVLDRYYRAAAQYNADPVIRITADCPCLDSALVGDMLEKFKNSGADYLSNTLKRTFPHGLDAEIFSFSVLERAAKETDRADYREHVTAYIYKSGLFNCINYDHPQPEPGIETLRVTLDTEQDYAVLAALYDLLGERFSCTDIINCYKKHPWLKIINQDIIQKKVFASADEELSEAVSLLEQQGMMAALEKLRGNL